MIAPGSPGRLLAKRAAVLDRPRDAETLAGHTQFVLAAADELLEARGGDSLRAAGLVLDLYPHLKRIVRLAALCHDLGKCSDHFQAMIRGQREAPQLVRHEALSLLLCWPGQMLSYWLRGAVENDDELRLALVVAVGHHRKFWSRAVARDDQGAGTSICLLLGHPDFGQTLARAAEALRLSNPPDLPGDLEIRVTRRDDPRRLFVTWEREFRALIPYGSPTSRLLAVGKAILIAADVAGSALPRAGRSLSWIKDHLTRPSARTGLLSLVDRRLAGAPLRPFQHAIAASASPVTLVHAGCGTGKTVAAYMWAAERHSDRQLWVTYPTTGTATEGFRDYVSEADIVARLEHSRAEIDLELFGLTDEAEGRREHDRLDAIRAWGCDVVTCTVDTVLGLVQNQRKGIYAWPGLARAAVVFDEIHAYDDLLFGCLLRFLEALPGIPALLMTASLPLSRLEALRSQVERTHGLPLAEIEGSKELERLARYQAEQAGNPEALATRVLEAGGKVLWVCNTVSRCIDRGENLAHLGPLIYHSRFRYLDRVQRHGQVVERFRTPGPALAVTTQVCELSLDLSADLLVTDLAPIPALIQRLGRLNRRSTPENPEDVKPFVVLPFAGEPYGPEDLSEARDWVSRLEGRDLAQCDLVVAWGGGAPAGAEPVASAWLDGGFSTEPGACREPGPSIDVLLPEDAEAVRRGIVRVTEVLLPMNPPPRGFDWQTWPQVDYYPVAPSGAIDYDERRGGRWRRP